MNKSLHEVTNSYNTRKTRNGLLFIRNIMKYTFHVQLQNSLKEIKVNRFPKTSKEIKITKR